jgi:hypothetical protein
MKTPSQRQKWLPYFRSTADKLSLRDWRIEIDEARPSSPAAIASVCCCEGRKYATIYLNDCFFTDSRSDQRHTVAHELVHCHAAPYAKAVEMRTGDDQVLKLLMEIMVDGLADAIAPLLPLPPAKL